MGRCRKVKNEGEKKGGREFVGKAAGDECVFIPGRRAGLADEGRVSTPCRTRRAARVTGPLNRKGQSTGRPWTQCFAQDVCCDIARSQFSDRS